MGSSVFCPCFYRNLTFPVPGFPTYQNEFQENVCFHTFCFTWERFYEGLYDGFFEGSHVSTPCRETFQALSQKVVFSFG